MDTLISFANSLITIQDPRIDRAKKHNLVYIVMITLCATICGMEGLEEIEVFAEEREDWFKGFIELPNGIPSHDTLYRVFPVSTPRSLIGFLLSGQAG